MLSKYLHKHQKDKEREVASNEKLTVPGSITVTGPDGGPEKAILERQSTLSGRSLSTRQRIRRSIFGDREQAVPDDVNNDPEQEAKWEEKATVLVKSITSSGRGIGATQPRETSNLDLDEAIQEAINLHQQDKLLESFHIFTQLADPQGANNPLAQVMCGLSLRHGWGCEINVAEGVRYFELAAKNSANIEEAALKQGSKAGGKAKGELAMALYELANCHRHGWGMAKDPKMAFKYYQMAANMGDIESKNETAWCLENGYGTKKDKFAAAQFYRAAEKASSTPAVGNSWIWKPKYDPKPKPGQSSSTPPKK